MGRVKIGTSLDRELLERAQEYARLHGSRLNEVMEEALRAFLERRSDLDYVSESFGSYRVTPEQLREILAEDIYDTDDH